MPSRRIAALMSLMVWVWLMPAVSAAQDRAGEFDHYLLALSWAPSYCAAEGGRRQDPRCAPGAGTGWALHGLWPQHAGGSWPEYCPTVQRPPSRAETAGQSDLFGTSGAAWHQWNKHGRCTGLSASAYFALSRAAIERLRLPPTPGSLRGTVSPGQVAGAFVAANPGLDPSMLVTTCRDNAIHEVRLCLTRDLNPRPCDAAVRLRGCALTRARLPPVR